MSGLIQGIFGGGSAKPAAAPPPPDRSSSDVTSEAERQRAQFYSAQGGRALTMLTGGQGASEGTSAVVRLLGGSGR